LNPKFAFLKKLDLKKNWLSKKDKCTFLKQGQLLNEIINEILERKQFKLTLVLFQEISMKFPKKTIYAAPSLNKCFIS